MSMRFMKASVLGGADRAGPGYGVLRRRVLGAQVVGEGVSVVAGISDGDPMRRQPSDTYVGDSGLVTDRETEVDFAACFRSWDQVTQDGRTQYQPGDHCEGF